MAGAIEVVARALYEQDKKGRYVPTWELAAEYHPWYKQLAEVAINAFNSTITEESDKPERSVKRPVLQDWVLRLPLMQQTVLLTAIRGPDGIPKYGACKMLLRWYRRCVLLSAMDGKVLPNPADTNGGSFTGPSITLKGAGSWISHMNEVVDHYIRDLDGIPMHFHTHLMHGAQIIGYKHPDDIVATWWDKHVYVRFVHHMHLHPEALPEMDKRLSDNRDNWLARNDPATTA